MQNLYAVTTNTTLKIWEEMTTDELVARLYWLNNEAPLDDPKYDDEYWDIVFTLTMRGDICENA